jgi:hypothetical protein
LSTILPWPSQYLPPYAASFLQPKTYTGGRGEEWMVGRKAEDLFDEERYESTVDGIVHSANTHSSCLLDRDRNCIARSTVCSQTRSAFHSLVSQTLRSHAGLRLCSRSVDHGLWRDALYNQGRTPQFRLSRGLCWTKDRMFGRQTFRPSRQLLLPSSNTFVFHCR